MTGKKTRGNSTLHGLEVGPEALGILLRMTANSVTRLAAESGLPKNGRGLYPVIECLQWHFARLEARALENPGDLQAERCKLIKSQREGQDLANAQSRAAMLSADLVATAIRHLDSMIAARLDELPLLAPELSRLRDPAAISRRIQDECREVRTRAAGDILSFAASLDDGHA